MKAAQKSTSMTSIYVVYAAILAIALFQVLVAMYRGPSLGLMLLVAGFQAALAVLFFMHLAEERPSLILALVPYTLFVLLMMNMFWPDSFRLLRLRPH